MNPTIEPTGDGGLRLHDPVEGASFELLTDRPVSPSPADPDRLPFPVDSAVRFDAGSLVLPKLVHVTIRRPDGEYLAEFDPDGSELAEGGDRLLDISTAPMVLYLQAPGPMTFRAVDDAVHLSFDEPGEVVVGTRSFHERPAATVTVPPDPGAMMEAVSTFGSALQTTTPERSYPTLRGHPPRVELGTELSVPDALDPPPTDVTVAVPPELEYVYPAAPLAYYLGATLRPGDRPAIHAGELTHPLDGPGGFGRSVTRTLQRVFMLDCVVRTEGLYRTPLSERAPVAELLPDGTTLSSLYAAPPSEQLATYLSLPTDPLDELLPEWPLCVDVEPDPAHVEALPYLVDDLALVRCHDRSGSRPVEPAVRRATQQSAVEEAIDGFVRSDGAGELSGADGRDRPATFEGAFRLPEAPAVEQAYIGSGCPLGVNKCSVSALRRRVDRSPADGSPISVRIVCNDEAMASEDVVEEYYGLRELVQFDVTVDYGLSTRDLRGVLGSDVDFLHYVGHIDEEGIACADGRVDVRTVDDVGVDAFLLNACSSYGQGRALVEAGAQGGVVTNATVSNLVATAMGRTLARALNSGFTLRSALSLADDHHATAYRYLVLGDGGLQLVQGESGIPYSLRVEPLGSDHRVDIHAYPAVGYGPGITFKPHVEGAGTYLPFGRVETLRLSTESLLEFLDCEVVPVSIDGQLYWSDELSEANLG